MKNATFYVCHKLGHIVAYCHARRSNSNQLKIQTVKRLSQINNQRRQPHTRYASCFYGYCFCCKEFGHKIIECRKYGQRLMFNTSRRFMNQRNFVHTHNSAKIMIKCCVCNQVGHMPSKFPLKGCDSSPHKRYQTKGCFQWKKKVNKCDLDLTAQDLKSQWYLDSGCSKHMIGDRSKLITHLWL